MKDFIQEITTGILRKMNIDFETLEIHEERPDHIRVNIVSPKDSGLLIGWHGQTLLALQHVVRTIFVKERSENVTITMDVENYRKKQEDNIIDLAKRKAERVLATGESEFMPPMHPYYRKIVHQFFSDHEDMYGTLDTVSEGEGEERKLKIIKK